MGKHQVCTKCGADAPEGEFLQHFADCTLHPNKIALARIEEIRSQGGNTKDFQAEVAANDTPRPIGMGDKPALRKTLGIPEPSRNITAPALVGAADFVLSAEMMQTAMKLFLETYFNLHQVAIEKVTGNNTKGYKVRFRSGE